MYAVGERVLVFIDADAVVSNFERRFALHELGTGLFCYGNKSLLLWKQVSFAMY